MPATSVTMRPLRYPGETAGIDIDVNGLYGHSPKRVCILTLHGVGEPPRRLDPEEARSWITVNQFERLLDAIADRPEVRLTFDDGNTSDIDIALPRLLERRLSARFFVLAGRLREPGRLDEVAVRSLVEEGMEIGSHGWGHRNWRTLSAADARQEIDGSLAKLTDVVGREVRQVAVPFGSYDRIVLRRLRTAGVTRAYTSDGGPTCDGRWLCRRTSLRSTFDDDWLRMVLTDRIGVRRRARRTAARAVKRLQGSPR